MSSVHLYTSHISAYASTRGLHCVCTTYGFLRCVNRFSIILLFIWAKEGKPSLREINADQLKSSIRLKVHKFVFCFPLYFIIMSSSLLVSTTSKVQLGFENWVFLWYNRMLHTPYDIKSGIWYIIRIIEELDVVLNNFEARSMFMGIFKGQNIK